MKPRRKVDKVTLERIYRKVLALEKEMTRQIALNRLGIDVVHGRIDKLRDALVPIVKHCERLLREKEHLRALIYPGEFELRQANQFMAEPPVLRDVYSSDFEELI